VRGLDPDRLDERAAAALRDALDTHLVIFLPGLGPNVEQLRDIGALFGELEVHPYIDKVDENTPEVCVLDTSATPKADIWHTDVTYSEHPPIAALLHMVQCPPAGGDTMWINCYEVYDSLSAPMQAFLAGLTCIHDDGKQGSLRAEHPVVRVHPGTGRLSLYVNKQHGGASRSCPGPRARPCWASCTAGRSRSSSAAAGAGRPAMWRCGTSGSRCTPSWTTSVKRTRPGSCTG